MRGNPIPGWVGHLVVLCCCLSATFCQAAPASSLLDISADGKWLACTNRDAGTVTILDLASGQRRHEVAVGKHPEGATFVGSSSDVLVAIYAEDRVVVVDGEQGTIKTSIDVFDEPYGVVSSKDGKRAWVTLDYPGRVVELDLQQGRIAREYSVGKFTRGLALSNDEQRLFVTEYYSGTLLAVDVARGQVVDQWPGYTIDNLSRQVILHPHRPKAYLAHIGSKISAAHGEGSIFPYVSIIDTQPIAQPSAAASSDSSTRAVAAAEPPRRRRRIPMDSFRGALVTANPWDCGISPDGKTFVVVFAGTDDMFVCQVIDDDYRELGYRAHLRTGKNPRAVRFAADGRHFYVYDALDFRVVEYSTDDLQVTREFSITQPIEDAELLRGKVLFYSALQPMASRRWISCASCHPDGQPDARTWSNPEGPRNTQPLAGMAWTHPIHWSSDRDEVQDFEYTVRGQLMQGRGLLRGELHPELGEPNSGRSADLDALAVYSNAHAWSLSPHAKGGLSAAAQRGRELFFSERTQCATCHSGPFFTDSKSHAAIVRHNVGTGVGPREKLPPEFDTPTLLGVYRSAPYMHDGQAATLHELLTTHNSGDKHGKTSGLTAQEVDDLVEFLQSLPYEDPLPAAKTAGYQEVRK